MIHMLYRSTSVLLMHLLPIIFLIAVYVGIEFSSEYQVSMNSSLAVALIWNFFVVLFLLSNYISEEGLESFEKRLLIAVLISMNLLCVMPGSDWSPKQLFTGSYLFYALTNYMFTGFPLYISLLLSVLTFSTQLSVVLSWDPNIFDNLINILCTILSNFIGLCTYFRVYKLALDYSVAEWDPHAYVCEYFRHMGINPISNDKNKKQDIVPCSQNIQVGYQSSYLETVHHYEEQQGTYKRTALIKRHCYSKWKRYFMIQNWKYYNRHRDEIRLARTNGIASPTSYEYHFTKYDAEPYTAKTIPSNSYNSTSPYLNVENKPAVTHLSTHQSTLPHKNHYYRSDKAIGPQIKEGLKIRVHATTSQIGNKRRSRVSVYINKYRHQFHHPFQYESALQKDLFHTIPRNPQENHDKRRRKIRKSTSGEVKNICKIYNAKISHATHYFENPMDTKLSQIIYLQYSKRRKSYYEKDSRDYSCISRCINIGNPLWVYLNRAHSVVEGVSHCRIPVPNMGYTSLSHAYVEQWYKQWLSGSRRMFFKCMLIWHAIWACLSLLFTFATQLWILFALSKQYTGYQDTYSSYFTLAMGNKEISTAMMPAKIYAVSRIVLQSLLELLGFLLPAMFGLNSYKTCCGLPNNEFLICTIRVFLSNCDVVNTLLQYPNSGDLIVYGMFTFNLAVSPHLLRFQPSSAWKYFLIHGIFFQAIMAGFFVYYYQTPLNFVIAGLWYRSTVAYLAVGLLAYALTNGAENENTRRIFNMAFLPYLNHMEQMNHTFGSHTELSGKKLAFEGYYEGFN